MIDPARRTGGLWIGGWGEPLPRFVLAGSRAAVGVCLLVKYLHSRTG